MEPGMTHVLMALSVSPPFSWFSFPLPFFTGPQISDTHFFFLIPHRPDKLHAVHGYTAELKGSRVALGVTFFDVEKTDGNCICTEDTEDT